MRLVWTDLDNTEIRKMIDEGPDFTHEEWIGFGIALEKTCKPFPTCETCDKYQTEECEKRRWNGDSYCRPWFDDFCKDHQDFTSESNGKDM